MVAAVLQSSVVAQANWRIGAPDLVLLAVLAWNLVSPRNDGLVWAAVGGLILDSMSQGPFGAMLLSLAAVAAMASFTEGRLFSSSFVLPLVAIIVSTAIYHGVYLLTLFITGTSLPLVSAFQQVFSNAIFLNLLLIFPVFWIARRFSLTIWPVAVEN